MKKFLLTTAAFMMIGGMGAAYAGSTPSPAPAGNAMANPTFTDRAKTALQDAANDIREVARETGNDMHKDDMKFKKEMRKQDADFHANLRKLHDAKIMNSKGQKIGEVEEVLVDPNGNIVAIAAEITGALDEDDDIIIEMDQLTYRNGNYITTYTSEELMQRPRFAD